MSSNQPSSRFPSTALIGWWPELVAGRALAGSLWGALLTGVIAATLQIAIVVGGEIEWVAEPFPDLDTYLENALADLPCSVIALLVFWMLILGPVVAYGYTRRSEAPLIAKIICLSPLATVIPGVTWSICSFIASLADPYGNIIGSKPAWLASWPIQLAGSSAWMIVGILLMTANGLVAYRRAIAVREAESTPSCRKCGYNLTANTSGTCPECGVAVLKDGAGPSGNRIEYKQ